MTRSQRSLALALLALAGCAPIVIDFEELTPAPIAIVYRSPVEARERAERLTGDPGPKSQGTVVHLDDVGDFISELRGNRGQAADGRLALFDPQRQDLSLIDATLPGAVPLDWDEDRGRLLFASQRVSPIQLFEFDLATRTVRQATRHPGLVAGGAYGPDRRLAYLAFEPSGGRVAVHLYVTGPQLARPRQLLTDIAADRVAWAPDGSRLAYAHRLARGRFGISLVDPDPSGEVEPQLVARGRDPVYTPDGRWIVYSQHDRQRWRLWRMRPDGTGKTAIGSHGTTNELAPAVSPDGRYVAYVSEESRREILRVRRFDGTGDRLFLDDGGDGTRPRW